MELKRAQTIAENMIKALSLPSMPTCERIEIAGSIRRGKEEVNDIELIAIPILKAPRPQFGEKKAFKTPLDKALWGLERSGAIEPIKGGDKYKKFWILHERTHLIKLDLFLVTPPAQWGVQMVIRTGPNKPENNFSQWMVTQRAKGGALPDQYCVQDGGVYKKLPMDMIGGPLQMPEEKDFFELCEQDWIEPCERVAKWSTRS